MKNDATTKEISHLDLPYTVAVRPLKAEEGGGFVATIPQLGSKTFIAVGETREEALEALDGLCAYLIPVLLAEGEVLPEPEIEEEAIEQFSGSLMLRVPRLLHARMVAQAKRNGCSINKMATHLLAQGLASQSAVQEMREAVREVVAEEMGKRFKEQTLERYEPRQAPAGKRGAKVSEKLTGTTV